MHFKMSSAICFTLAQSKFLSSDKGLRVKFQRPSDFSPTPSRLKYRITDSISVIVLFVLTLYQQDNILRPFQIQTIRLR